MARYLVIGGAGTLGVAVCDRLVAGGHEVVVYDLIAAQANDGRLSAVRGDVTDGLHLLRTAREHAVEAIIHLASLLAAESSADPGAAVRINSGGMVNVLETARILKLRRVVWASSVAVFGRWQGAGAIPNDAPYAPRDIYAGTKVLNELLALHYATAYGVDSIGLRFPIMTGAGKPRGISGVIGRELFDKPARGLPGRVPFGDDWGNWLWIEDAARALALAAAAGPTRTRLFNTSGDVRSFREVADVVRALIPGADISLESGVFGFCRAVDASPIEEELGFRSDWRLEDQARTLIERARRSGG